jgi:hypothetical protein
MRAILSSDLSHQQAQIAASAIASELQLVAMALRENQ